MVLILYSRISNVLIYATINKIRSNLDFEWTSLEIIFSQCKRKSETLTHTHALDIILKVIREHAFATLDLILYTLDIRIKIVREYAFFKRRTTHSYSYFRYRNENC